MRIYGAWAGNPTGNWEDKALCIAEVPRDHLFSQCGRKRGHGPAKCFCKQHAKALEAGQRVNVPDNELVTMDSAKAREFSRSLKLYETCLRVTTPGGTSVTGVVLEIGLMPEKGTAEDHEGVCIDGAGWFSLRTNEVVPVRKRPDYKPPAKV